MSKHHFCKRNEHFRTFNNLLSHMLDANAAERFAILPMRRSINHPRRICYNELVLEDESGPRNFYLVYLWSDRVYLEAQSTAQLIQDMYSHIFTALRAPFPKPATSFCSPFPTSLLLYFNPLHRPLSLSLLLLPFLFYPYAPI